ncbi:hypothetical protein DL93DRAFT_2073956 [Clavulina sp. PMI_390]|nr:hypothetical protein DL93DRAFT_2073956 [Clavulina sp. PMI_390]
MPRKVQRKPASNDSDSDSDAPETVQKSAAREGALGKERAVKDFHASTAKKRKEANRARDEARKSAADERRRKTASSSSALKSSPHASFDDVDEDDDDRELSPETLRLQERMERSMQQADAESDDPDDELDDSFGSEEDEPTAQPPSTKTKSKSKASPSAPSKSQAKTPPSTHLKSFPDIDDLDDDVFEGAFAAVKEHEARRARKEERLKNKAAKKGKQKATVGKKKGKKASAKDAVLGSTVVRALAPVTRKAPAPESDSHKQFLKSRRKSVKGRFERRPVNLALSSGRPGPALGFARNR